MTQEIDKERAAFEALIEAFENVVFDHARGHEPVQEVTRLREEIMEAWQASRASSVAPAGGVREIGKLRELLLDARYAMSGLLALVRGECPALIDTDRGGGGEGLKVEDCIEAIDAALSHPAVSDAQQVPSVGQQGERATGGGSHV